MLATLDRALQVIQEKAFRLAMVGFATAALAVGEYTALTVFGVYIFVDNFIKGVMGGDDYIGLAIDESKTPYSDGQASPHNIVIIGATAADPNGEFSGRATFKPYTSSGVYIGPVATVKVSHPSGTSFPVGSVLQLGAYGLDQYGTQVPNRPVTWSSSNPAVAPVDAYGAVAGQQSGSATITATIDGVSASVAVYAQNIGDPVQVDIYPGGLSLGTGDRAQLTARLYDSNGYQVPVDGNYRWASSNPSSCDVSGDTGIVSANGGWGAYITVTSSEGLTDTIFCSVNGGQEMTRIPERLQAAESSRQRLVRACTAEPFLRRIQLRAKHPRGVRIESSLRHPVSVGGVVVGCRV